MLTVPYYNGCTQFKNSNVILLATTIFILKSSVVGSLFKNLSVPEPFSHKMSAGSTDTSQQHLCS